MPNAASSTSQSNETVTLRLPSGEDIDAIVPNGLSDDQVKSYVQMKRPDLFGAPAGVATPKQAIAPIGQGMRPQSPMLTQAIYGPSDESTGLKESGYPGPAASEINPYTSSAAMAAGPAGLAGQGVAASLPFLRQAAVKHPVITQMVLSEAISQARQLPYVGKAIPPYAEWLPFLLGGTKGKAETEPTPQRPVPAEPTPQKWTPPEPPMNFQPKPAPRTRADLLDDQAVAEQARERADREMSAMRAEGSRQQWYANTRSTPKGVLVEEAGGNVPQKPVKYTKTPKSKSSFPISSQDDLTQILQQSLDAAKAKRGQ